MIREKLADLLYPPKCMLCGRMLESGAEEAMCPACALRARPGILRAAPLPGQFFESAAAPFYFEGPVRAAVLRMKFSSNPHLARAFARYMAKAAISEGFDRADKMTWVPSRGWAPFRRGYTLPALLAKALYREARGRLPAPEPLLVKIRATERQFGLPARKRRENVAGAFQAVREDRVRGFRILLVDDTLTTGATVSECAMALLAAGALRVDVLAAARTPRRADVKKD